MTVDEDRNGNQWAWWGATGPEAVLTGSHLDSVPEGGAYDGALGLVSAFVATDVLRALERRPSRPFAIVNFNDEEGGRFGIACSGSRLMIGSLDASTFQRRMDSEGITVAQARQRVGFDHPPGPDPERLAQIGVFVELHIEQGRKLVELGVPVGVASAVWPHGRWRFDFAGRGNHAGTTPLVDRRDPMIPLASTILAARAAAEREDALATVGRVAVVPGATNAIASHSSAWLDARAPRRDTVSRVVEQVTARAHHIGDKHGVIVSVTEESFSPRVDFGTELRSRIAGVVAETLGTVAELPTGAGHDAAILAAHVPSAMLFVRNRTGVSHVPAEFATRDDCLAGVAALVAVLQDLW
jgi:N-carbamoyl-L-amino-acid hydrolase